MDKHTKTICRQIADELLECVWPFCGIETLRVKNTALEEFVDHPLASLYFYRFHV